MRNFQWMGIAFVIAMTFLMGSQSYAAQVIAPKVTAAPEPDAAKTAAPDIQVSSTVTPTTLSSQLPDPVGRVLWVKGKFTAIMSNLEKRELQKTSLIYVGDTLLTDASTTAQIVFTDNSLMTFRPGTKFVVDQYSYQPNKKSGSAGKYIMNLIEGGFRTITGIIAKANPSDYQVNTPVATIGVRGTDYEVYVKDGELFIGRHSGVPCVENNQKKGNICLSKEVPYASDKTNSAPVPLSEQPDVFKEQLQILPAVIAPFGPGGNGPNGGTTGGGTVSSFCIQ